MERLTVLSSGNGGIYRPRARALRDDVREDLRTVLSALSELRAAKWDVKHVDAMNDMVAMGLARDAAEARALAAEEALRPLADDPAVAALMDCQYRAGALAGWNAAHHADPEEGEKIMARIRSVEPGSLSPIVERNLDRATRAEAEAADLRKALEPFARLEVPKKSVGNAGAYSILHSHIRAAQEALSTHAKQEPGE